jgi:hypothetical protein
VRLWIVTIEEDATIQKQKTVSCMQMCLYSKLIVSERSAKACNEGWESKSSFLLISHCTKMQNSKCFSSKMRYHFDNLLGLPSQSTRNFSGAGSVGWRRWARNGVSRMPVTCQLFVSFACRGGPARLCCFLAQHKPNLFPSPRQCRKTHGRYSVACTVRHFCLLSHRMRQKQEIPPILGQGAGNAHLL